MMSLKGISVRIVASVTKMFQSMKTLWMAMIGKPAAASDGVVEKLHKITGQVLLFVCFIIMAVEIFGQPINCSMKKHYSEATKLAEYNCWYSSICFPPNSSYSAGKCYEAYYQWSPAIIFFQGLLFLLVLGICRCNRWFASTCLGQRCPRGDTSPKVRTTFLAFHVLMMVNVVVNLIFVDWLLEHTFSKYGFGIVKLPFVERITRDDGILAVFPQVVQCSVDNVDYCFLSINVLNEKIFIILCLWLFVLAAFICLQMGVDCFQLLFSGNNRQVKYMPVKRKLKRVKIVKNQMIELEVPQDDQLYVRIFKKPLKGTPKVLPGNGKDGDPLLPMEDDQP